MMEVEQKFRLEDFQPALEALTRQGANGPNHLEEQDLYWNAPDRDFAQTGEAFRIRCANGQCFFTYKGPKQEGEVKIRNEIEIPLGSKEEVFEQHAEMLTALGYRQVAWVEKIRLVYQVQLEGTAVTVSLDEVKGLGKFAEVEVLVDSGDSVQAADLVRATAALLGLTQWEPRSYLRMVLQARGK
ncbi:MAG: class IV adenylate cyclase [Gemmataceae bacterium]|nr:class IV adenylate cyclase [Gemmataceae bacterium]